MDEEMNENYEKDVRSYLRCTSAMSPQYPPNIHLPGSLESSVPLLEGDGSGVREEWEVGLPNELVWSSYRKVFPC